MLSLSFFRRSMLAVVAAAVWPGVAFAEADSSSPPQPSSPPSQTAPVASAAPLVPSAGPDGSLRTEVDALRQEVQSLRAQVESSKTAAPTGPTTFAPLATTPTAPAPLVATPTGPASAGAALVPPPTPRPLGYEYYWPWVTPPDGLSLTGYLQSQYESHQDSQDQLNQNGTLLNKDRFLVRRARVSLIGDWQYAAIAVELDANTTNGPQVDLRKAEASLQYRPDRSKPPIIMATLGQFDTPFGYELVESPRTRWFMERSQASLGFWPGEPDLGVRLSGALSFFRWTIAAVNGEPLGENSPYALQDPNAAKDVLFRFGFDTLPREDLHIAGGISTLRGRGFSPGTPASKSGLQWQDLNDDGIIETVELTPISAGIAQPSQNFDRWAAGADLRAQYKSPIGVTKLYGEFMLGSNMDRNQYFADPIQAKIDQRELGYYVAAIQEIGPYAVVGFRYDFYDPNSNLFDKRQGLLLPYSEAIKTASPLVGLTLPDRARLVFQYDIVRNALARTAEGVPMDLKANVWTLRLQVQL